MSPEIQAAITRAAKEEGVDPSFALAVAERESDGNPNAKASRSIYGLFQMSGDLRGKYGAGDSRDPYTQAQGWARFINDTKQHLTDRLGREPSNNELYLAHYFGEGRASRLIGGQVPPSAGVADVFTPNERRLNPEFDKAGTVGNLMTGINADIENRQRRYGGSGSPTSETGHLPPGLDFARYGQPDEETSMSGQVSNRSSGQGIDFSKFGQSEAEPVAGQGSAPTAAMTGPGQPTINTSAEAMRTQADNNILQRKAPQPDPVEPGSFTPSSTGEGEESGGYRWTRTVDSGRPGQEIDLSAYGAQGAGPGTLPPDLMPHGMDVSDFRPSTNIEDARNKPGWQKGVEALTRTPLDNTIDDLQHPFRRSSWPPAPAPQPPDAAAQFGLGNTQDELEALAAMPKPPPGNVDDLGIATQQYPPIP